jgi:hypothetical protein
VLTQVAAAPTNTGATITWTTDVPATSQVAYGPTAQLGTSTPLDAALTTSHSVTISGLLPGTQYFFQVSSADASQQLSTSSVASFTTTSPSQPPPDQVGQWGSLINWPLVAVHSSLMPNGNVLLWDGWETPSKAVVWNPATQAFTDVTTASGLFCSGHAQLADGRVLVAGGHDQGTGFTETGIVDANIFNPANNQWTRVADMHFPRWYPSATTLPDGRVLVISGMTTSGRWADTPEVYNPATNTWTLLTGISTPEVHEEEYPLTSVMPDGRVLVVAGKTGAAFIMDVNAQTWTAVPGAAGHVNGSAAFYAPGKILYTGGGNTASESNPAFTGASVLDATVANPAWRSVSPMAKTRYMHSTTVLPDGQAFIVGGANVASQQTANQQLVDELWNPSTEAFTQVPPMIDGRIYHSSTLLMPDGRVLVAGGGRFNANPDHFTAQYYSPPYLFKGARPTISAAPSSLSYGQPFTVQTPDAASISSAVLVDLGSDTHTEDFNQRRLPLTVTRGSGSISVQGPANSALAPPGHYMLFGRRERVGHPAVGVHRVTRRQRDRRWLGQRDGFGLVVEQHHRRAVPARRSAPRRNRHHAAVPDDVEHRDRDERRARPDRERHRLDRCRRHLATHQRHRLERISCDALRGSPGVRRRQEHRHHARAHALERERSPGRVGRRRRSRRSRSDRDGFGRRTHVDAGP